MLVIGDCLATDIKNRWVGAREVIAACFTAAATSCYCCGGNNFAAQKKLEEILHYGRSTFRSEWKVLLPLSP